VFHRYRCEIDHFHTNIHPLSPDVDERRIVMGMPVNDPVAIKPVGHLVIRIMDKEEFHVFVFHDELTIPLSVIVVAFREGNLPVQFSHEPLVAKITETEYPIILSNMMIPVTNEPSVHLLDIPEFRTAPFQDIPVIEMHVRDQPDAVAIEYVDGMTKLDDLFSNEKIVQMAFYSLDQIWHTFHYHSESENGFEVRLTSPFTISLKVADHFEN
jgi:hypothetical protein